MSGGHYDYSYRRIVYLQEMIESDLECTDVFVSAKVKEFMLQFSYELSLIADKAKALEWHLSGDDGEDSLFKTLDECDELDTIQRSLANKGIAKDVLIRLLCLLKEGIKPTKRLEFLHAPQTRWAGLSAISLCSSGKVSHVISYLEWLRDGEPLGE